MTKKMGNSVIRLSMTMVAAAALAYSIAWPLAYIAPLFVWNFLSVPEPFGSKKLLQNILCPAVGCLVGLMTSIAALHYPMLFLLVTSLLLWFIFSLEKGRISDEAKTWLIIGLTLVPMVSMQSQVLIVNVIRGVLASAVVASCLAFVSWKVFPNPGVAGESKDVRQEQERTSRERQRQATLNLLLCLPAIIFIYAANMPDKLLVLIFIALLAPSITRETSKAVSSALVLGNTLGGIAAIVIYILYLVIPELPFLLLLLAIGGLLFSTWLFSGHKTAPLGAMGYSTALLIIGSATMPFSDEVQTIFLARLFNIFLVVLYIFVMLRIQSIFVRKRTNLEVPETTPL